MPGATPNQSVSPADKSIKPRFLRLTGVTNTTTLAKMNAGGDKMET